MEHSSIKKSLSFDDVLIKPARSSVLPSEVSTFTKITSNISLGVPLISSAMDTVTEYKLAIAIAQSGGMGILHKNMSIDEQSQNVSKVKKFETGMVIDPLTILPSATLADALELMKVNEISGIPVVDEGDKLLGILTNRDVRFATNMSQKISELMTSENLVTVKDGISTDDAQKLLHKHRIEKLLVVDDKGKCIGLITVKDIEKSQLHPNASKDQKGRLIVGAAIGVGEEAIHRAEQLVDAGVDVLVIDTAHGHSEKVISTLKEIKSKFSTDVIVGNVATNEATEELIDQGADCVKVGIGPGSICTTRIIAGVGMPQITAIINCAKEAERHNIPIIADGGIRYSGDFAKSIASGASCVMVGSLLAGTDESPGEITLYQGRSFKNYRGMGSIGAMARGSADRYFQKDIQADKLIPEGIEGQVPYKGSVNKIIYQLVGGLKASMGYTGNENIKLMKKDCKFIKITGSGLSESHVHDVRITNESPNYSNN